MKIKIDAVSTDLVQYKNVLERYKFEGDEEKGTIEINTPEDIFNLTKDFNNRVIINDNYSITIYDDWLY